MTRDRVFVGGKRSPCVNVGSLKCRNLVLINTCLTFDVVEADRVYCSTSRRRPVRWAVRDRHFLLAARILFTLPVRKGRL